MRVEKAGGEGAFYFFKEERRYDGPARGEEEKHPTLLKEKRGAGRSIGKWGGRQTSINLRGGGGFFVWRKKGGN